MASGAPGNPADFPSWPASVVRITDGDTQRFVAVQRIEWPEEVIESRRQFLVRLLETNCPERDEDYEGWQRATAFVQDFLYDPAPGGGEAITVPGSLILTGRKDPYGRWLGWFVRHDGSNLSYAINNAGVGEYKVYAEHVAELLGEET